MLGRGGFGVVWLVTHKATEVQYAAKVIEKSAAMPKEVMRHYEEELKVLKLLK